MIRLIIHIKFQKTMKKLFLVTLFLVTFFLESQAQYGLPPTGYFDMIIVFPPEASNTFIESTRLNFGATQLNPTPTPITQARLWRMRETGTYRDTRGATVSYTGASDAVEKVRGSTSSVGGGALVQINTKTQIPDGNFKTQEKKNLAPPLPITSNCSSDREYIMPNSAIGTGQVRVAILDTGLDCNEAGSPVVFVNPMLSRFVDAADSKSFVEYPNARDKVSGHGTAVASLIVRAFYNAGKTNCRIIPIKVLEMAGHGTLFTLINGIDYAIQKNVDIINISIVSPDKTEYKYKTPIDLALDKAQGKQILVVSAAGNDGHNINLQENYVYPACSKNEGQLVVGAAVCSNSIASLSNYGKDNVDIFAPGVDVEVQRLNSTAWWIGDGTSYSAPIAAGMAAVLRTRQTVKNAAALKCAIAKGSATSSAFSSNCVYGGTISSSGALRMFEICNK